MIKTNLFTPTAVKEKIEEKGPFSVFEYTKDVSLNSPVEAVAAYYAAKMNIRKRQVVINLAKSQNGAIIQAGAMAMMLGEVSNSTNVKGMGDFVGKLIGGKVSGESTIKPKYSGSGCVVLEPTYKHILIENISDWNGTIVLEDGLFLASEGSLEQKITRRTNLSSAVAGGEGLFNLALKGEGHVVLESPVPASELIQIELENDVVKIDGNYAIAWSDSLNFTVQKAGKSFVGSVAGGEGLVNVFEGTGKILLAPVI